MKLEISPRLKTIAKMIDKDSIIADIGTDHAYVPIYLILKGICNYAIASDVRKGPVEIAKKNIYKYSLEEKIEIRLGNGLEKIKYNEVDTIIIAGMGGVLITEILNSAKDKLYNIKKLILQPMLGQKEVREWLMINDYSIVDEKLVKEEKKIYTIIVAEHGKEYIEDNINLYIGKKLIEKKDPLLNEFLEKEIKKYTKIINNVNTEESIRAKKRLYDCVVHKKKLIELYNEIH